MALHLLKREQFVAAVEKLVQTESISYIDAVLVACEDFGIAPEGVKALIPQPMKEIMENEFQELNLIPQEAKLPV